MKDYITMGGGPDEPGAGPRVKCLHCGDVIQSMYRHDFKWCSCHSVAVDGGADYLHMNHSERSKYVILKDDENPDDHKLVGPRDTSQDREWCYICEQLELKSNMTPGMVEQYGRKVRRYACITCVDANEASLKRFDTILE